MFGVGCNVSAHTPDKLRQVCQGAQEGVTPVRHPAHPQAHPGVLSTCITCPSNITCPLPAQSLATHGAVTRAPRRTRVPRVRAIFSTIYLAKFISVYHVSPVCHVSPPPATWHSARATEKLRKCLCAGLENSDTVMLSRPNSRMAPAVGN